MDTISAGEPSQVISEFLKEWNIWSPYYRDFAKAVAKKCKRALKSQEIEFKVFFRAKEKESLGDKLKERLKNNPYKDKEAILSDIQDLAGVQIVLNWSQDKNLVHTILSKEFEIEKCLPKTGTWNDGSGQKSTRYTADHYVARRQKQDLELKMFGEETRVEIQVISMIWHAFAEIEHDYGYKERYGRLTLGDHNFLNSLGKLVGAADDFLSRFKDQRDLKKKLDSMSFENYHELGACLSKLIAEYSGNHQEEDIGPTKGLQHLLKFRGLDNPSSLRNIYGQMGSIPLDEKEAIMDSYGKIQLSVSVRMMDYMVFSAESTSHEHESDIDQFTAMDILAIITSAFIWLNELFSPATAWQRKLLSKSYKYGHEVKYNDLPWLATTRMEELRDSETISTEDEERLRRIARWFSHHTERPVQLAFSISILDPSFRRDLRKEWHLYVRAIAAVDKLKTNAVVKYLGT